MVIIESLKRNVSRITIFIGDLSPLFLIVYIIYFNTPYSIYTLVVLAVSIAMAFYWKVILNLADDSKEINKKIIQKVEQNGRISFPASLPGESAQGHRILGHR